MTNEEIKKRIILLCESYGILASKKIVTGAISYASNTKCSSSKEYYENALRKAKSLLKIEMRKEFSSNKNLYFSRMYRNLFTDPYYDDSKKLKIINDLFETVGPLSREDYLSIQGRFPKVKDFVSKQYGSNDSSSFEKYPALVSFLSYSPSNKDEINNIDETENIAKINDQLMHIMESGNSQAIEKLLFFNQGLVSRAAHSHYNVKNSSSLDFDDLMQLGNEGLLRAIECFDLSKGKSFSTYATLWIKQAIERGIDDTGRNVRVPVHRIEAAKKTKREIESLEKELGHFPSEEEILKFLKISRKDYLIYYEIMLGITSVDKKVNGERQTNTLADFSLIDNKLVDEEVFTKMENEYITNMIDSSLMFNENERFILKERLGLTTGRPATLSEVAKSFSCSHENIRQIQSKALQKIKTVLIELNLKDMELRPDIRRAYLSFLHSSEDSQFDYLACRTGLFDKRRLSQEEALKKIRGAKKLEQKVLKKLKNDKLYDPLLFIYDSSEWENKHKYEEEKKDKKAKGKVKVVKLPTAYFRKTV